MKDNVVQEKSFKFSLEVIKLYKQLQEQKEYIISKQLLRSGTSIGANVEEAIQGQSKKDFLSKINISLKEAVETQYWLKLLKFSELTKINVDSYLENANELVRILTAIVKNTKI